MALSNLGVALLWSGQVDNAEPYLLAARSTARDAGLELTLVNTLGFLGLSKLDRGESPWV